MLPLYNYYIIDTLVWVIFATHIAMSICPEELFKIWAQNRNNLRFSRLSSHARLEAFVIQNKLNYYVLVQLVYRRTCLSAICNLRRHVHLPNGTTMALRWSRPLLAWVRGGWPAERLSTQTSSWHHILAAKYGNGTSWQRCQEPIVIPPLLAWARGGWPAGKY